MKAKRILTLILALAVCLSGVSAVQITSAFAADKELVILDTTQKASITKAGFTADDKNTKNTKYSAKWDVDKSPDIKVAGAPKDFSQYDTISFSAKAESTDDVVMMLYFGSENSATTGIDYYSTTVKLKPGEWTDVSVKYGDLKPQREPLGWNSLSEFSFRTKGWNNKAAEKTVIYIENVRLSGSPVANAGSITQTPVGAVDENNKTKVFYYNNFDGDSNMATGASVAAKSNSITQEKDSGDNGFVKIAVTGAADDCYFEARTKSTKVNDLVVEIDLSTTKQAPSGNLQYKDTAAERKQGTLFSIDDNGAVMINNKSAGKLKNGTWLKLGFIIDFAKYKCTAYVDGKKQGTYDVDQTLNDLAIMRMYVNKSESNIGKDLLIDNFAVYGGTEFRDVSKEYEGPSSSGKAIAASAGADVEMKYPALSDLNGGVALMLNKSAAYANGKLTKVDADNESVVPVVINDRTLVPVRFIAESFGADVSWDDQAKQATVKLGSDTIIVPLGKAAISVNGTEQAIDVEAQIIENRTFLPLRAVSEALGKNVLWDSRGLIVITNKDTELDSEKDVKLSTMLIGLIENGTEVSNYASAPKFTQSIIDEAVASPCGAWTARAGNSNSGEKSANIIYYLTLAARFDPNAAATNGTLCKDAALKQIRFLIAGGHEPYACVGCYWGHAVVASALLLVKNTPVVYNELTADEKDRMDWLMRGLAIAGNWGFNDKNDYKTGFDLLGNFGKTWNPNYRNTYLSVVLSAGLYFGLDELDKIFTEFDYDTYIKKYEELGYTNILETWTVAGKDLMEKGGECTLLGGIGLSHMEAGQPGGTGAGVKIPFVYNGQRGEAQYLFKNLSKFTYAWKVISEYGTPGTDDHTHILSGKKSPLEGQMGMLREFAAGDGGSGDGKGSNIRSRCTYGYDSYEILVSVYANMKLLAGWDSSTQEMREIDNRIYVGNEDLLFKMEEGYYGYSSGHGSDEYEYMYLSRGQKFVKDIWKNFHCMLNEQVTTVPNPNQEEVKPLEPVIKADPKDGITQAPEGAFKAVLLSKNSTFEPESYYSIGDSKKSGEVEFDIVIGENAVDEIYDSVVMLDKKSDKVGWSGANMLIQFKDGTIKLRDGSAYKNTEIRFGSNYRFHAKVSFDVATRKYTVTLQRTYPTESEVYTATDFEFRKGAKEIDAVDSLCIVNSTEESIMWVENFKVTK